MTTIHVAVEDETAERVAKMSPGRGGRGSAYVRALLEQRESEVRGALRVLESAGWDRHHIRQACGALDGAQHTHGVASTKEPRMVRGELVGAWTS